MKVVLIAVATFLIIHIYDTIYFISNGFTEVTSIVRGLPYETTNVQTTVDELTCKRYVGILHSNKHFRVTQGVQGGQEYISPGLRGHSARVFLPFLLCVRTSIMD